METIKRLVKKNEEYEKKIINLEEDVTETIEEN